MECIAEKHGNVLIAYDKHVRTIPLAIEERCLYTEKLLCFQNFKVLKFLTTFT